MGNNDFDIFELFKILVKQKVKLFAFFLLFFALLFAYQFTLPAKYSVNFIASSTVLQQNEILLKVTQIKNLLDNNAKEKLANVLDISLVQAESIDFVEVVPVKNSAELVDIKMATSDIELPTVFEKKLKDFIAKDSELWARRELKKEQLEYALGKLNQELDSLKVVQQVSGVYIATQEQNLIDLIDKKIRIETDITFFNLFNVYKGYEIIKHKTSLLMQVISSALFAFALAIVLILAMHFYQVLKNKIEA